MNLGMLDLTMARLPVSLLALTLGLLSAGCGNDREEPIRLGANVWPGYEGIFLARTKGYTAEGVPIELVEFGSLPDVRRAFERGQIDAMASTVIEVIQAREFSDRRPQVFLIADYSDGTDVILGAPEITSIANLRSRRVAAELASLGVFLLRRALETAGMSLDDITVVPIDQSEMRTALSTGHVEAVLPYPSISIDTSADGAVQLFSSSDISLEVVDVLSVYAALRETRQGDIAAIIRA